MVFEVSERGEIEGMCGTGGGTGDRLFLPATRREDRERGSISPQPSSQRRRPRPSASCLVRQPCRASCPAKRAGGRSTRTRENALPSTALGEGLRSLAGKHPGLVYQPAALVGHRIRCGIEKRRRRPGERARSGFSRGISCAGPGGLVRCQSARRSGELGPGSRRARHLVSSWLWPFATMGWPEQTATLKTFYPTTDLVTGPDIIFFWVARMIMAGYEFMEICRSTTSISLASSGTSRAAKCRDTRQLTRSARTDRQLRAPMRFDSAPCGARRSDRTCCSTRRTWNWTQFLQQLWNACRFRQMQHGTFKAK